MWSLNSETLKNNINESAALYSPGGQFLNMKHQKLDKVKGSSETKYGPEILKNMSV